MSESEVNHILKGKGILEDQGHTFIKAQDKYEVNIIYLISHALVETGNGNQNLLKALRMEVIDTTTFMELALSMKMLSILVKAMLNNNPGLHLVKQLWVAHLFVRNHYFENNQLNLYQMRWNTESWATPICE